MENALTEQEYEAILSNNKDAVEKTSYGVGEMTTAIYLDGKQLAVRIISEDTTEYFKGQDNV